MLVRPRAYPGAMLALRRHFSSKETPHQRAVMGRGLPKQQPLPGGAMPVMVAAGKGGVGKSTLSVNLALALQRCLLERVAASPTPSDPTPTPSTAPTSSSPAPNPPSPGATGVGLLDLDLFGPSLPHMMGLQGVKPRQDKEGNIVPVVNYGIHCMSLGLLVPPRSAVVWRGPLVMQSVQRLVRGVAWPRLHALLLDMPPTTGDVALSVAQLLPVRGAVLVSTPQDVALADVYRAAEMLQKVSIPVLGVVQNMSHHVCANCGNVDHIFGHGEATAELAASLNAPLLGSVPLSPSLREAGDTGRPLLVTQPSGPQALNYMDIASKLLKILEKDTG